jgi:hypothetical protein
LLVACAPKARRHAPSKTRSDRTIFIPELARRRGLITQHVFVTFVNGNAGARSPAQEQHAHVVTGDNRDLSSHKHLSAGPVTRLGSAVVIAAFAAVTIVEAGGTPPAQSTSAESRPASNPEVQALILRDCRDVYYGRVDGFEGMLSDFVCGS